MTFPSPLPLVDTQVYESTHNHDGITSALLLPSSIPAHTHTIDQLPSNLAGIAGPRGNYWFVGTGDPGTIAGQLNGDLYNNTTNGAIWKLNVSGTWVDTGLKITGPQGLPGNQGIPGVAGNVDPSQVVVLGNTPQVIDGQKDFKLLPRVGSPAVGVAMPTDITAQFVQEAYQNITLLNGFTNYGQGWANAQYRHEFNGRYIRVRGIVKGPATDTAANIVICNLPLAIKPMEQLVWSATMDGLAGVQYVNRLSMSYDASNTFIKSTYSVPAGFRLNLNLFYPLV